MATKLTARSKELVDALIASTKEDEGFRAFTYIDPEALKRGDKDHLAIGYGFDLKTGPFTDEQKKKWKAQGITRKEADKVIVDIMEDYALELDDNHPTWNSHPDEVAKTLLDMNYNMGITKLNKFGGMWKALDKSDYSRAREEVLYVNPDAALLQLQRTPYWNQTKSRAIDNANKIGQTVLPFQRPGEVIDAIKNMIPEDMKQQIKGIVADIKDIPADIKKRLLGDVGNFLENFSEEEVAPELEEVQATGKKKPSAKFEEFKATLDPVTSRGKKKPSAQFDELQPELEGITPRGKKKPTSPALQELDAILDYIHPTAKKKLITQIEELSPIFNPAASKGKKKANAQFEEIKPTFDEINSAGKKKPGAVPVDDTTSFTAIRRKELSDKRSFLPDELIPPASSTPPEWMPRGIESPEKPILPQQQPPTPSAASTSPLIPKTPAMDTSYEAPQADLRAPNTTLPQESTQYENVPSVPSPGVVAPTPQAAVQASQDVVQTVQETAPVSLIHPKVGRPVADGKGGWVSPDQLDSIMTGMVKTHKTDYTPADVARVSHAMTTTRGVTDFNPYTSERFFKNFDQTDNMSQNLYTVLASRFPELAASVEGYDHEEANAFAGLSVEDRRAKLIADDAADIEDKFGWLPPHHKGLAGWTGAGAKYILDPMNLVPMASVAKVGMAGAVASTAAFGAADAALYDMAQKGELDAGDIAIGAAIGAVIPPAFEIGKAALKYIRGAVDSVKPIKAPELLEAIEIDKGLLNSVELDPDKMGYNLAEVEFYADNLNYKFSLDSTTEMTNADRISMSFLDDKVDPSNTFRNHTQEQRAAFTPEMQKLEKESWGQNWKMIMDSPRGVEMSLKAISRGNTIRMNADPSGKIHRALAEAGKEGPSTKVGTKDVKKFLKGRKIYEGTPAKGTELADGTIATGEFGSDLEAMYAEDFFEKATNVEYLRGLKEISEVANVGAAAKAQRALEEISLQKDSLDIAFGKLNRTVKGKYFKAMKKAFKGTDAEWRVRTQNWGPSDMTTQVLEGNVAWTSDVAQAMQPSVVQRGGFDADAIYKAIADDVALTDTNRWFLQDWADNITAKYANGKVLTRPSAVLNSYGMPGRMAHTLMRKTQAAYERKASGAIVGSKSDFYTNGLRYSKKNQEIIVNLLRKIPTEASPKHLRTAQALRRRYNQTVLDAQEIGIYSAKEADALIKNAAEKGYFPRVVDKLFLNSKVGKQMFLDDTTKIVFTNKTIAERAIQKMVGKDSKTYQQIIDGINKNADGKYVIGHKAAEHIFNNSDRFTDVVRSTHLETSRRIPEEFEELMQKYWINDFDMVNTRYFDQAYRRIEWARNWGKKDEMMDLFAAEIEAKFPGQEREATLKQLYWGRVGDRNNEGVKSFIDQKEHTRKITRAVSAFEILKLATSPIINVGQFSVNAPTIALGYRSVSTYKAYSSALKAQYKAVKGSLQSVDSIDGSAVEMAKRHGAIHQSITTAAGGEIARDGHTLGGKLLKGVWNPLSYLSDPTKFLKAIGFTTTEEWNRTAAYFYGRDLVEHMLENKIKLLKLQATGKLKKRHITQMRHIDRDLSGLGIDPSVMPENISIKEIDDTAKMLAGEWDLATDDAALKMVADSQFAMIPGERPFIFDNANFKLFLMFKSFAFRQGTIVKDNIIKPATQYMATKGKEGSVRPLIHYMLPVAGVGGTLAGIRTFIKGDDNDLSGFAWWANGIYSAGGAGLAADFATKAAKSPLGIAQNLAGPAGGDVGNIIYGGARAIQSGDVKDFGTYLAKTVGPGPKVIANFIDEMEDLLFKKSMTD